MSEVTTISPEKVKWGEGGTWDGGQDVGREEDFSIANVALNINLKIKSMGHICVPSFSFSISPGMFHPRVLK